MGMKCFQHHFLVSDFIFLASVYEGERPVLSLTVSSGLPTDSARGQCAYHSQLARGHRWRRNLEPVSALVDI